MIDGTDDAFLREGPVLGPMIVEIRANEVASTAPRQWAGARSFVERLLHDGGLVIVNGARYRIVGPAGQGWPPEVVRLEKIDG